MEEKFTQIRLNLGPMEEASVEPTPNETEEKREDTLLNRLDDPETIPMDIAENRQSVPLGDDVVLVSPDESIFNDAADAVNKPHKGEGYAYEWHNDTNADSGDDLFEANEMYASSTYANRSFMETFGITDATGSVKTVSEKEITQYELEESTEENTQGEYEYTERLQNSRIKKMYDFAVAGIGKRLIFSVIFAAMLFFVENITLFIKEPTGFLNINNQPYAHIGISFGLLVLCAICAYEQLYHGFRSILTKDYLPESIAVVAFVASLVNSISAAIFVSLGNTSPRLFNFATSAIFIGTILFSFVNVVREEYGFGAVSSKDTKFILERVTENNAEAEFDTFTTTTNGEFDGQIARIGKTDFVKNYFYNSNTTVNIRRFMSIYYLVIILASLAFAIVSLFREGDLTTFTSYWGIGIILLLPIGALCSYSVPFYIGNKKLYEDGVAILGEEAVREFAKTDIVAVNDTTAFPPHNVKITNFNVYNGFDIEKILYYASNGFSIVGGPLAEVFASAANDSVPTSKLVRFVCSGRSSLGVRVDSDKVIFADKFGITSQCIEVGNEREEQDDICIMYIAVNGKLASKMYIKYEIDDEFLRIVKLLNKNGTGIGIRTFDPNLNNDLLKKLTTFRKSELRIIKLSSISEVIQETDKQDAKIVSEGLSRSLIKAIPICKKILSTRKAIRIVKIISSIVGAVLLALWVFGKLNFIFSAHLVGYHMIFTLIALLVSYVSMPKIK